MALAPLPLLAEFASSVLTAVATFLLSIVEGLGRASASINTTNILAGVLNALLYDNDDVSGDEDDDDDGSLEPLVPLYSTSFRRGGTSSTRTTQFKTDTNEMCSDSETVAVQNTPLTMQNNIKNNNNDPPPPALSKSNKSFRRRREQPLPMRTRSNDSAGGEIPTSRNITQNDFTGEVSTTPSSSDIIFSTTISQQRQRSSSPARRRREQPLPRKSESAMDILAARSTRSSVSADAQEMILPPRTRKNYDSARDMSTSSRSLRRTNSTRNNIFISSLHDDDEDNDDVPVETTQRSAPQPQPPRPNTYDEAEEDGGESKKSQTASTVEEDSETSNNKPGFLRRRLLERRKKKKKTKIPPTKPKRIAGRLGLDMPRDADGIHLSKKYLRSSTR